MSEKLTWAAFQIKWSDMIPFEKNARKIKAENKKNLSDSIDEFGMASTPTLDFDNVIIGGHQRHANMLANGFGEELAYVMKPNRKLTEAEFKKLNLILNSQKHAGDFDLEMLNEYFAEFDLANDFGIDIPDFASEMDALTEKLEEPEYPIVPKFSEKYSAFVIVCQNEIDENHLAEKLGVEVSKCYKSSKIGMTHIVPAKQVMERWR